MRISQPPVSLIVPVFGAEKYIQKFACSLFEQTLENVEYIFVDDCSPDCSIAILEQMIDRYPNRKKQVRIIRHEENRGVSMSRQDGLDAATGEYVIHADPDDWVEPEMLEQLYQTAIAYEADMVICDFYMVNPTSGRETYVSQQPKALKAEVVQQQLFQNLHGSCWNKLVKLQTIRDAGITFPHNYAFCEDLTFITELLNQPLRIAYLPKAFYHYVWAPNTQSLSSTYTARAIHEEQLMQQHILNVLSHRPATAAIAQKRFNATTAVRTLLSGSMSAKDFKLRFAPMRDDILATPNGKLTNFCLKVALTGYSGIARQIFCMIQKVRNTIFKLSEK